MRRALGIGGIVIVAAASIALIVTSIGLDNTGTCARGGPYAIAHECSDADLFNGAMFGVSIVALTLGSILIAFTLGPGAMFVAMGVGFTAAGVSLLIAGKLVVAATVWTLIGVGFLIGMGISWWRGRGGASNDERLNDDEQALLRFEE